MSDSKPANGTRAEWYSDNGSIGYIGHWQDGELVQDRQMTWVEYHGGGSTIAGLLWFAFATVLYVGVPLGIIFLLVRFVKWAWQL
jgi:hypothetical protein